jgi:predicted ATPase
VLAALGKLGVLHVPEAARKIIQEQMSSGGTALPWLDKEAYTLEMLRRSIVSFLEHTPAPLPLLSDRGIPDTLCYSRLAGTGPVREIEEACRRYRYARTVFLAPPWKEIYRTDAERKQDFTEAERTFRVVEEVYREYGYDLVELPKAAPSTRAKFILERLA